VHGCALSVGTGTASRGVLITGTSGAGKTTLVAELLRRAEHPVTVINDDWGAVSLRSGRSVSTGERRLHMKSGSVRALRPDFFTSAPPSSYRYDRSDPDRTARLLVAPQSVYGTSWGTGSAVIDAVAVIVREPPDWAPPARPWSARTVLGSGAHPDLARHGERFFNASLILPTGRDERREEHRYQRLLDRVTVCLINNCDTPDLLAQRFSSAVLA